MRQRFLRYGAYTLFWSWNLIFLAFMFLGFAPTVLPEVLNAVRAGLIPVQFLVYGVILASIPALAVVVGATLLRTQPRRLLALGYGVQGPLMIALGMRFFLIRQTTASVTTLLIVAGLALLTFLWQILDRRIDERHALWSLLRVLGLALLLALGVYVSVWLAFYVIPLGAEILKGLINALWNLPTTLRSIGRALTDAPLMALPFLVLGSLLFLYTATLLVVMPIAIPVLYVRAWRRGVQATGLRLGWTPAAALTIMALLACVGLFMATNRQPQQRAFALLAAPPTSPQQAQELLHQQETIRAGLLNAYLSSFRYISAVGEVDHIAHMYESAFNLTRVQARRVQGMYEQIARPLLYTPAHATADDATDAQPRSEPATLRTEALEAAELYAAFFDRPINEGERSTVVDAVRATWLGGQAQAAWQAVDHREVYLRRQEVTVTDHGAWADIELYEVYENRTLQQQEVVYYFSLPESAVIRGVWLGNSPDRDDRFAYQVAPRGAAQAVYRNEVQRRVDPALVEQIGPRQYRLRAFPVEPLVQRWDSERSSGWGSPPVEEAPPLHLWLTIRVLAGEQGFALPQLAERRNVFWDSASVRLINGDPMTIAAGNEEANAGWLPRYVPAQGALERQAQRIDFPGERSVLLQPVGDGEVSAIRGNMRLAVVLDRSRSMVDVADEVEGTLSQLRALGQAGTRIDLYLTASDYRGEEPSVMPLTEFDPTSLLYYGGQNAAQLLMQFDDLQSGQPYDGILVITDGTGYALGETDALVPHPSAPVWMVHLGGSFPLGYDDPTLEAIQASGGGVAGNLDEALTRLALAYDSEQQKQTVDIIDGYIWRTLSPDAAAALAPDAVVHAPTDALADIAARRLILAEMQRLRGDLSDPTVLDGLHALALEHSIVTPYSSMIVLVNTRQEQLLKDLADDPDRFTREAEAIGETLPETVPPLTGVPEPEEWLLLVLVVGALGWYVVASRRKLVVMPGWIGSR